VLAETNAADAVIVSVFFICMFGVILAVVLKD
jgi:cobalamin biosynthesis protein CobD/CbiB